MLNIIWMLFVAWFLNLFGLGGLFVKAINQMWGIQLTLASYYFIFAVAGLIKNVFYTLNRGAVADAIKEIEKLK